jgi:hypothetical protein
VGRSVLPDRGVAGPDPEPVAGPELLRLLRPPERRDAVSAPCGGGGEVAMLREPRRLVKLPCGARPPELRTRGAMRCQAGVRSGW